MSQPEYAVYRFFNGVGRLLYVGMSSNPGQRWQAHRTKPWWHDVANITVAKYPTREAAQDAEANAIATEQPQYNITGKSGAPRRRTPVRPDAPPKRRLASLKAAAEYLDCHERTVRRMIRDGKLKAYRVARNLKVDMNEVEEMVAEAVDRYTVSA